jgi:lactobin A/cerein 7B family class IIb bacteriocin
LPLIVILWQSTVISSSGSYLQVQRGNETTPQGAERKETKMKNEMKELSMKELDLNELEQVNGGDFLIGAAIICGLIYYGTMMAVAYSKK